MIRWTFVAILLAAAATAPPPIRHVTCPLATGPIAIDGKADEAAWSDAVALDDFRLWRTFGDPTEHTTARLCYDDDFLYALFECVDCDIYALYDERDARTWESDVVELFLQPDPANPMYYEFEIAPNNTVFDGRFVNTGSGGFRRWAKWNCAIQTATTIRGTLNDWTDRDEGYTVEVAIPRTAFSEVIGERPFKGQTWKFAAVRADLSVTLTSEERSSTANVPDGDIHRKDGYFTLAFE
jgi:cellulose/xylan binding protein with CBM9 domain